MLLIGSVGERNLNIFTIKTKETKKKKNEISFLFAPCVVCGVNELSIVRCAKLCAR